MSAHASDDEVEFEEVELAAAGASSSSHPPLRNGTDRNDKAAAVAAQQSRDGGSDDEEMEEVHGGDEQGEEEMEGVGADGEGDDEMEEVVASGEDAEADDDEDAADAYADLHDGGAGPSSKARKAKAPKEKGADGAPRIYYDGKGQHAGVVISLDDATAAQRKRKRAADAEQERKRQRREAMITPRDRQNRIAAHKLGTLALLAWAKMRNGMLQDDELQAWLADQVPKALLDKQRRITPRREPNQRERVRMFEAFLTSLVGWWKGSFTLDATACAGAALRQPDTDLVNGAGLTWARPGRRVDGWVYESAAERVERQKAEREALRKWQEKHAAKDGVSSGSKAKADPKGKGKQRAVDEDEPAPARRNKTPPMPQRAPEIALFPPGQPSASKLPAYLRLAENVERIASPRDLLERAIDMRGSRETSASLFAALCRAIGIPARLVISPQVPPWSVAAAKVATTGGDAVGHGSTSATSMAAGSTDGGAAAARSRRPDADHVVTLPSDVATSDEEATRRELTPFDIDAAVEAGAAQRRRNKAQMAAPARKFLGGGSAKRQRGDDSVSVVSIASSRATSAEVVESSPARNAKGKGKAKAEPPNVSGQKDTPAKSKGKGKSEDDVIAIMSDSTAESAIKGEDKPATRAKGKQKAGESEATAEPATPEKGRKRGKGKGKAKDEGEDYRDEKWKGISEPLKVTPTIKLRPYSQKRTINGQVIQRVDGELEPVNLQYPPTVWVEVFSKPFQKWLTVDPVRGYVFSTGNRYMEPIAGDRQNKLVYVVAFEEDGYARDVTPRYTKTLHSRIARMRPPPSKAHGDWWESVVRAISRPFKLDRDAVEDVELEENASKEPMPSSVGGFKDHPVYAIEKHLKRDEIIFPPTRVGTFQKMPVYLRSNVVTCRSARQWMNEGRSIKANEQPLKLVKARAYTISNKRAEEQAKAEGQEGPQEGLYARFQTELYRPPPVIDGKIPTNSFGNIDLYVPSMLPEGAAHIPYSGTAKVAKKLGISYAEAVVGFEFKKFRGMPKMAGIVVPKEHEETVLEAFWASEEAAVEKEAKRKEERALKNWRKLINAVKIAQRVNEEYGGSSKKGAAGKPEVSRLRPDDDGDDDDAGTPEAGGFIVDDEQEPGGFLAEHSEDGGYSSDRPTNRRSVLPSKYGTAPAANGRAREDSEELSSAESVQHESGAEEYDPPPDAAPKPPQRRAKIVSLEQMIDSERDRGSSAPETNGTSSRRSRRAPAPDEGADEPPLKRTRTRAQPEPAMSSQATAASGSRRSSRRSQAAAQNSERIKELRRSELDLDKLIDSLE